MGRRRRTILQVILEIGGRPPWWATLLLALGTYALLHQYAVSEPAMAADPQDAPGAALANALRHVAAYAQYIVPWVLVVGLLTSAIRRAARAQLATPEARPHRRWQEEPAAAAEPVCPRCESRMVRRTATRGRNAGNDFWGCSRPACHATLEVEAEERYPLSA